VRVVAASEASGDETRAAAVVSETGGDEIRLGGGVRVQPRVP